MKELAVKYRLTITVFTGAILYGILCLLFYFVGVGVLNFFMLYLPGTLLAASFVFALKNGESLFLGLLLIAEYFLVILYISKDYDYLEIRRITMGSAGAFMMLLACQWLLRIKLSIGDYIAGIILGFLTTIFIWDDNFNFYNPWLIIVSVVLWQISVAFLINRKILIRERNYGS